MKRVLFASLLLLFLVSLETWVNNSCKHEAIGLDTIHNVCFDKEILPIFTASCALSGCHDSSTSRIGFNFSSYPGIRAKVTPGSPEKSNIYKAITDIWSNSFMPPSPAKPLSQEQRSVIYVWIKQGALNYKCDSSSNGGGSVNDSACFSRDILPLILSNCGISGCHDANTANDDIILVDYQTIRSIVTARNINNSPLYLVLLPGAENPMPPYPHSALDTSSISLLRKWINEGAVDNTCFACDTLNVTYSAVIFSIIANNCRSCHSGSGASSGIHLENYTDIKIIASNGLLVDVIYARNGKPLMPLNNALPTCPKKQIEIWVQKGANNN
jgi:hypothetical protein